MKCFVKTSAFAFLLLEMSLLASEGIILNERVNVRTRPSISSEVIHQLHTGEKVKVFGKIDLDEPQQGEPSKWVRIQIPKEVELWVFSQYIDASSRAVTASRLNVRSGPSQYHSVVGRISRGTIVETIRVSAGWTAIKPLPKTIAYVAAEFVREDIRENENQGSEDAIPEIIIDEKEIEDHKDQNDHKSQSISEVSNNSNNSNNSQISKVSNNSEVSKVSNDLQISSRSISRELKDELKRIITRDGILKQSLRLQAPTFHRLDDPRTGTTINYINAERLKLDFEKGVRSFEGRKIRVIGSEAIDDQWPRIPVIEVERLRVLE